MAFESNVIAFKRAARFYIDPRASLEDLADFLLERQMAVIGRKGYVYPANKDAKPYKACILAGCIGDIRMICTKTMLGGDAVSHKLFDLRDENFDDFVEHQSEEGLEPVEKTVAKRANLIYAGMNGLLPSSLIILVRSYLMGDIHIVHPWETWKVLQERSIAYMHLASPLDYSHLLWRGDNYASEYLKRFFPLTPLLFDASINFIYCIIIPSLYAASELFAVTSDLQRAIAYQQDCVINKEQDARWPRIEKFTANRGVFLFDSIVEAKDIELASSQRYAPSVDSSSYGAYCLFTAEAIQLFFDKKNALNAAKSCNTFHNTRSKFGHDSRSRPLGRVSVGEIYHGNLNTLFRYWEQLVD